MTGMIWRPTTNAMPIALRTAQIVAAIKKWRRGFSVVRTE
jgi:hypothetical protein